MDRRRAIKRITMCVRGETESKIRELGHLERVLRKEMAQRCVNVKAGKRIGSTFLTRSLQ